MRKAHLIVLASRSQIHSPAPTPAEKPHTNTPAQKAIR